MAERSSGGNLVVAIIIAIIVGIVVYFMIDSKQAGEVTPETNTGMNLTGNVNVTGGSGQ